jgi:hypothetical protein
MMREWEWHDLERSIDKNPNGPEEASQISHGRERQDLRCPGSTLVVHVLELVEEQQERLVFKCRPGQTAWNFSEIGHVSGDVTPETSHISLSCADKLTKLRKEDGRPES